MINNKYYLIGESSWDLECAITSKLDVKGSFLHNDFFIQSNSMNSKFLYKLFNAVRACRESLLAIFQKKNILFSSFNSEIMIVAILFSFSSRTAIFCPNVLGRMSNKEGASGVIIRAFFRAYCGRVLVTDEHTLKSLETFKPQLTPHYFKLNIPKLEERKGLVYIVALPAVLSHKYSKNSSNDYYNFTISLVEVLMAHNLDVFLLPHPREEGKLNSEHIFKKFNFISAAEVQKTQREICYVGAYSSLVLNKRYGGRYGIWFRIGDCKVIPKGLEHIEDSLVDVNSYMNGVI